MQVHHIKDLESSLLRTPLASEAFGGAVGEAEARKRGNSVQVRDQALDLAKLQGHKVTRAIVNLPTPLSSDYKSPKSSPGYGPNLPETAKNLMPTPTTRDYKDGSQAHERDGKVQTDTIARAVFNSGEVLLGTPRANAAASSSKQVELGAPKSRLEDQVHTNWGKFEPAIRRWESILNRLAPEPTKPDGKDNNHRLSSKFTEWMMGLPDGWITGHDLKRNDELKLAGNGVVPQQAELALRLLLELPEER
jgi:DNA (cytosine-5)-methyltransferase 1